MSINIFLSLGIGIATGYVYGLLMKNSFMRALSSLSGLSSGKALGLSSLRFIGLAGFFGYLLRQTNLHPILIAVSFLCSLGITLWRSLP